MDHDRGDSCSSVDSGLQMTDPLTAATEALVAATWILAGVGVVQLFVNYLLWRANSAQADMTRHQLLSANRPRVRISWRLTSPARPAPGNHNLCEDGPCSRNLEAAETRVRNHCDGGSIPLGRRSSSVVHAHPRRCGGPLAPVAVQDRFYVFFSPGYRCFGRRQRLRVVLFS